jgi:hypothetical protein
MSHLELLPQRLRKEILRYLLMSERVRQSPDRLLIEHYGFQTSLLRVSRTIAADASAVLYGENTFAKGHWYFSQASTSMLNHEVPFYQSAATFNNHVVDITIKTTNPQFRSQDLNLFTFIILTADIPKLARLLRILDFANFMGFHFDFAFRHSPTGAPQLAQAQQILLPFEQVRGGALIQKVSITGPVDTLLAARVKQIMTQKVAWVRAGAWELYELAVSIKRKGDMAFKLRNADMAMAKYTDTQNFQGGAIKRNTLMHGCDTEWLQAICRLETIVDVDVALLALSDITYEEEGKRHYNLVPTLTRRIEEAEALNEREKTSIVPNSVIAQFYHLLGVAELGLEHPNKAGKSFAKGYKIIAHKQYKQGWEAAKSWPNLSKTDRQLRFDAVLATLPAKPLAVPAMKSYSTIEVESEHWVMRQLGFEGPVPYADKIKPAWGIGLTMKPHPNHHGPGPRTAQLGRVYPKVLRKHVERYRAQMNSAIAQGKLIGWVHLNADQIGEESIIDDPGTSESGGQCCLM